MEDLAEVNQKILADGESLPCVTLRNGTKVQTGTFATLLHNIASYNQGERGAIEKQMLLAIRALAPLGLFDLFSPQEWMNPNNPGRKRVGELAAEFLAKHHGDGL